MNPKQPQVTVIMPVHNMDRSVRRAVESLLNQSLRDFELLVVDDGSTDRTSQMLDSMAERDYRISVYHLVQVGAAEARNHALDHARGRYVYFMEADDWAEPGMLEDMVRLAEESSLELVLAGYYIDAQFGDSGEHVTEVRCRPDALYPTQQEFRAAAWQMFDQNLFYSLWNKLFVRARIEELGLRFSEVPSVSFPFVLSYIRDIERVGNLEHPYYHYVCGYVGSEALRWREGLYEMREKEHELLLDLYCHWGLAGDAASSEMINRRYIERLISCVENVCGPQCTLPKRERVSQIKRMIGSDRAQLAAETARPRAAIARTMLMPIKAKNAFLAYQEGRMISFAKRHNSKVFVALVVDR